MAEKEGFVTGFKNFILRGNAIDLAVGMVIGAAFTGVITALVEKFLNPLIGAIFGKPNFDNALSFTLNGATISVGAIITALVNLLLVGLALYIFVIIPMNKLHAIQEARQAQEEDEEESGPSDNELLVEIRDLLAANNK